MLTGSGWDEDRGAWASRPVWFTLLCFFFAVVAAFAAVTMGAAAAVVANMASTKSRTADRFMHFSC
jgi:hypothetical protein